MMVDTCNPGTQEEAAGRSRVLGQPCLYTKFQDSGGYVETLSQKKL